MVLVPATPDLSGDVAGWVATRPCAVWQLRAFLRLAGVVGAGRVPHGYLDARRFAALDGHRAVTDVFHDEAIAYAHWFGKSITGRFTLQAASALLAPAELDALMPPGTALWDAAEYLEGEREAVTRANLFADDEEDGDDPAGPPAERSGFGEWERHPHIGFATFVRLRTGNPGQLPPPIAGYRDTLPMQAQSLLAHIGQASAIGSPATVREAIGRFVERTQADEIMVSGATYDPAARERSLELTIEALAG